MTRVDLAYGAAPGLRFACLLDGHGGCTDLDWSQIRGWRPGDGVLWIHIERDNAEAQAWLLKESGVDVIIAQSLIGEDSRPRVDPSSSDDALMVFLRGVNRNNDGDPVDLVPIHMWIDRHRLISLRDRDHYLMALRDIREALVAGRGPVSSGDLMVRIAAKVIRDVSPIVDELEDEVDRLDSQCDDDMSRDWRAALADLRRQSVELRRYLAPQREALARLMGEEMSWLGRRELAALREVSDRVARYVESLDITRERSTLLHDHLTAQISERIAQTSNRLTAVAAILLPPSMLAGFFGMNVGGIPAAATPLGFWIVGGAMVALMAVEAWLLRRWRWI